jgi:hypothetical protein
MASPSPLSDRSSMPTRSTTDAEELVNLGKRHAWQVRTMGRAPVLQQPVYVNGWWLIPVGEDDSRIPKRAQKRVATIYASGLRPRDFVVAHQAPAVLTARGQALPAGPRTTGAASDDPDKSTLHDLQPLVKCLTAIAKAMMAVLALSGLLIAAVVDPILIAVTEDGYWVEIDRWWA